MSLPNGNAPNSPKAPNTHKDPAVRFLRLALLLAGIEGLAAAFLIGQTRSAEGSVLFGLSAFRLAMVIVILFASAVFLWLVWKWRQNSRLTARLELAVKRHAAMLAFAFFWGAAGMLLLALEPYFMVFFGKLQAIDPARFYQRLAPFTGWGALVLFQFSLAVPLDFQEEFRKKASGQRPLIAWLVLLVTDRTGQRGRRSNLIQRMRQGGKIELAVWLTMLAIWAFAAFTGVGLIPDDRFWNVAGVPLLPQQIVLSGLVLMFFLDLKTSAPESRLLRFSNNRFYPYLLMAGLWAAAVLVWQGAELQHTYFAPGPYPPNYERYPFSDARWFDIGGQYALIGEGLNNDTTTDRPFLMMYTALLHLLGGQQYDEYILVQLLFLALIPAGMFALGWRLHSKTAGFGMALLVILKERNAIEAATEIGLVNARVLMSELPTALLLIVVTILIFRWLKSGQPASHLLAVLAGGTLGLAVGIRTNTLALAPVVVAFVLLGSLPKKGWAKSWITTSLLFGISLFLVLIPYTARAYQQSGTIYLFDRYQSVMERSNTESEPPPTGKPGDNKLSPSGLIESPWPQMILEEDTIMSYSLRHFVHNEITSVLILPLNWQVASLDEVVQQPRWDYRQNWQGELSIGEKIAVGINLLILSIGIGYAFRRWRFAGLAPLAIHLGYHLSNAISRTSGGRYLVPVDWAVAAYFVLGVLAIVYAARGWQPTPPPTIFKSTRQINWLTILGTGIGFLLIGSNYLLADLVEPKYPPNSAEALLTEQVTLRSEWFFENQLSGQQLEAFVNSKSGVVESGLILYPRYYLAEEETPQSSHLPELPAGQNRITFLLLEEYRPVYIQLPLGEGYPAPFPEAVYGLVLGCLQEDYIEAKLVIPLEDPQQKPILSDRLSLDCSTP